MKVIMMTPDEIKTFYESYKPFSLIPPNEYMEYFFKAPHASISIYKSGKVVFQGSDLSMFNDYFHEDNAKSEEDETKYPYDFMNTIGSDEVGTGDVFGPIVVATAFVKGKETNKLKKMGVKDSKKISDEQILKIGKILVKTLKFKVVLVRNEIFNEKSKRINLNAMKALLHNQNIQELSKEVPYDMVCLDQFCDKKKYFSYLPNNAFKDISFEIRGESKSVAVAAASIIARSYFLMEMERLHKLFNYNLPKGSGKEADYMIQKIKEEGHEDILPYVAKLSFKNLKK